MKNVTRAVEVGDVATCTVEFHDGHVETYTGTLVRINRFGIATLMWATHPYMVEVVDVRVGRLSLVAA